VNWRDDSTYVGDDISIFEWPQPCCEIVDTHSSNFIKVRTRDDALALINSLQRLVGAMYTLGE